MVFFHRSRVYTSGSKEPGIVMVSAIVILLAAQTASSLPVLHSTSHDEIQSVSDRQTANDVEREYAELQKLVAAQRAQSFTQLPSAHKAAIWQLRLRKLLVAHPELSETQRQLILHALELLTPDAFEIPTSDPRWQSEVEAPLRDLELHAKIILGQALTREFFTELSEDQPLEQQSVRQPSPSSAMRSSGAKPLDNVVQVPACSCSTQSDYCDRYFGDSCFPGGCWTSTAGCGFFLRYPCDGTCFTAPEPI